MWSELDSWICIFYSQIDGEQMSRIMSLIECGKKEGGKLLAGGNRVGEKGFFIEPTVFADVTDDMTIAQEEVWAPCTMVL